MFQTPLFKTPFSIKITGASLDSKRQGWRPQPAHQHSSSLGLPMISLLAHFDKGLEPSTARQPYSLMAWFPNGQATGSCTQLLRELLCGEQATLQLNLGAFLSGFLLSLIIFLQDCFSAIWPRSSTFSFRHFKALSQLWGLTMLNTHVDSLGNDRCPQLACL